MSTRLISTSVLAKRIGKDAKELFHLLSNSGWMHKPAGTWQLTEKGKFEGGQYLEHAMHGPYIAWPESVIAHPLLGLLPAAPLTAAALGSRWGLPARLVNLILREAGLIDGYVHGWKLTALGRAMGGEQHEVVSTGVPYASWPEAILENSQLLEMVGALSAKDPQSRRVFDGHNVTSALQQRVDNWLYLTRVNHVTQGEIFLGEHWHPVDIYLPTLRLAIILWPHSCNDKPATPAAAIQQKLETRELFNMHHQDVIEIEGLAIDQLDELLSKILLQRGLAVY